MQKKSDIVYKAVLSRIEEEFWKPGQQIFSERQLAELYSVSRVTVKQAISQLVGEGYLEYLEGRTGTFVAKTGRSGRNGDNAFVVIALDNISPAFASNLLGGIHEALWQRGYRTAYCNTFGDSGVVEKIKGCLEDGAKGVLFSPLLGEDNKQINKKIIAMASQAKVPLVQIDRYEDGDFVSRVQCNNYQAMYDLSERLWKLGYRHPLVIKGIAVSSTEERLNGIRDAFNREEGIVSEMTVDEVKYSISGIVDILEQPKTDDGEYDVIIGLNGTLSRLAVKMAKSLDSSIVTAGVSSSVREVFNDFCVIQPLFYIGFDAGMLLVNQIEDHAMPSTHIMVNATLWP